MMQNGFRRIALAQGLLPERLPNRETPTSVETSDAPRLNDTDATGTQSDAWNGGIEMPVGNSA
jgi:hypothetical protein